MMSNTEKTKQSLVAEFIIADDRRNTDTMWPAEEKNMHGMKLQRLDVYGDWIELLRFFSS